MGVVAQLVGLNLRILKLRQNSSIPEMNTTAIYGKIEKMGRFKGQTIQLGGPERLLPTESTGIDLREARSMNIPPRHDRFDDRGPRRMDDRGFESGPRRSFRDREEDDGPRRSTSRWADESGRAEAEDDWRSGGPSRTASSATARRFEPESLERRSSTRRAPVDHEEKTAADDEDDWRATSSATKPAVNSSSFGERRVSRRDDFDDAPRRVTSRADDDDWRRGSAREAPSEDRIERTRSFKPAQTRADEEGDWRTSSNSATPWARKSSSSVSAMTPSKPAAAPVPRVRKSEEDKSPHKFETPSRQSPPVVEEDKWSSSEDEEPEKGPDMEKISKFAEKVQAYVEAGDSKKIESIVKKIPVNFGVKELKSLEPTRVILSLALSDSVVARGEEQVRSNIELIAPVLKCLESEFGDEVTFGLNTLEQVQVLVNSLGLPRVTPETALVELVWLTMYESGIVAEEMFQLWLDNDTLDSPGKSTSLFQTQAFRAWLYEQELPGVEATRRAATTANVVEDKDEWSDDSDSDIEALVPKRISTAGINLRPTSTGPLRR